MLNESLRIMKGTIVEEIQERKKKKILKKKQNQYIQDIVLGKFPELIIKEKETAKSIVEWCGDEENPVQFFLKQLSVVGIEAPVKIDNRIEKKEQYYFLLNEHNRLWIIYLSKIPKEYLIKEVKMDQRVFYSLKKIPYKVLGTDIYETILGINKGSIDFKYCRREQIKISIGEQAAIKIDEIEWNNYDLLELYPKAMNVINEIIVLDKNLEPYNYYMAIKQIVQKYYDLKGTELTFTMPFFTISTIEGKILDFEDKNKRIAIKNYNNWYYKEYCTNKEKVVFEKDVIKIIGAKGKQIQELIDTAEAAIKEVESLEY